MSNIRELKHASSISKHLKESAGGFVILGLTTDETSHPLKVYIRKWLKKKSKQYKHILFLYCCLEDDELGTLGILDKDKSKYPLIYHIYDVNQIFVKVDKAIPNNINESFDQVKKHYVVKQEDEEDDEISNNECDNVKEQVENTTSGSIDKGKNDLRKKKEEMKRQIMERKKTQEKIEILNQHAEKFRKKILKNIERRKREEKDA